MLAPSHAPAPRQVLHLPMPKLLAWLRDEQQAGQGLDPLTLTLTLTLTVTLTLTCAHVLGKGDRLIVHEVVHGHGTPREPEP